MAKTETVNAETVNAETVNAETVNAEAVNAEAVKAVEAAKTEKVFLPYADTHKRPLYVCVNGRSMRVERGKQVEIPAEFAEVVNNAIKQETEAVKLSDMMEYKAE